MCCQIIVTFLSVTRVEANLGVKSFFGAFMCHFCTFLCKHPNVCDKFADNWTSGIGSCRASHCLYMVAPVCEAAFSYVMWCECVLLRSRGELYRGRRIQTIIIFTAAEGISQTLPLSLCHQSCSWIPKWLHDGLSLRVFPQRAAGHNSVLGLQQWQQNNIQHWEHYKKLKERNLGFSFFFFFLISFTLHFKLTWHISHIWFYQYWHCLSILINTGTYQYSFWYCCP